jgi:hypothetical protein
LNWLLLKKFLQNGIGCEADIKKADWSRGVGRTKGRSHSFVLDILSEVEGFCYFFLSRKKVE